MTIRVGIIGTGHISAAHVKAFGELENVEVAAACSRTESRLAAFVHQHGILDAYTDYHELLDRADVDAVIVATPNDTHEAIATAALRAGKHVLLEKPMALDAAGAGRLVEVANTAGYLLMVGMCNRFTEKAHALRGFVSQNLLGQVYYARAGYVRRRGNPGGWFSRKSRAGGGPVIDLGVHIIDLVRFLVGNPRPVTVTAAVFSNLGMRPDIRGVSKYRSTDYDDFSDVEDGATALVRFENGMALAFETSWVQNIKADRMYVELYGDRGGAQLSPGFELYSTLGSYMADVQPVIDPALNDTEHRFLRQAQHFVDCLVNGVPCISPPEDGYEVMRIIDAIYESGRLGHDVSL